MFITIITRGSREVYDGDEPRAQEGCTAQAWSVAEVLIII